MSELADCTNSLSAKDILRAATKKGPPFYINVLGLGGFIAQYQTVYDSFTTKPSAADATIQDTWVTALVAASLWSTKKDVQYNFAIHTNDDGEAQTNWLNPGTYDCTLVNAPTFTAYEGFTGDGISAYIDTNYIPSSNGINYIQNSASLGVYSRSNIAEISTEIGTYGQYAYFVMQHTTDNTARIRLNSSSSTENDSNIGTQGLFIATRTAANIQVLYKNGSPIVNGTNSSSYAPNVKIYILAMNNGGSPLSRTTKQISCAFIGGGLIQANITSETDNYETYMDAMGKGVIP